MDRLDAYEVKQCTSRGLVSEVYQATHVESGTVVALKRIKIIEMHPTLRKECQTEVNVLQMLDHPHLIKYHSHFCHEGDLYLVMELATGGTLANKIEMARTSGHRLDENLLWRWIYDVSSALAYLHGRRILHRDVKPSHIFIGENGQAKLGDFGLSKAMSVSTQCAFSCVGTPFYMCPEIVRGEGYSFASDVWSFGCSVYELAAGYPPFYRTDMDFRSLGEAICCARYPALPTELWSADFLDFVEQILEVDPSQRPTAQQLLDLSGCKHVSRIQDFKIIGTLGRGKFSEVHRSMWKAKGDLQVALKRIQVFDMDSEARQVCNAEINMLQRLEHVTIIKYLTSFFAGSELIIVLELAAHGDLSNLCRRLKSEERTLAESQNWSIFFQACEALHHMHKQRIMHRDIKPANIFIAERGVVKLGDLGLGRYFSSNTYRAHSVVGTPFYMSPEVIMGSDNGYSFKSDMWSLGCVLYELTTLVCPFAGSGLNYYALGNRICRADYARMPEATSHRLCSLCDELLRVEQDARPDATATWNTAGRNLDACCAGQSWARKREDEEACPETECNQNPEDPSRRLPRAAAIVRGLIEKPPSPPGPRLPRPRPKVAATPLTAESIGSQSAAAAVAAVAVNAAAAVLAAPGGCNKPSVLGQSCTQPPSARKTARPACGYASADTRRRNSGSGKHSKMPTAATPLSRELSPRPRTEEAASVVVREPRAPPCSAGNLPATSPGYALPSGTSSPSSVASAPAIHGGQHHKRGLAPSPPGGAKGLRRQHSVAPEMPLTSREHRSRHEASPRKLLPLRGRMPSPEDGDTHDENRQPRDAARKTKEAKRPKENGQVSGCTTSPHSMPGKRSADAPGTGLVPLVPSVPTKPLHRRDSPRTSRLACLAEQALLAPGLRDRSARAATPPPRSRGRAAQRQQDA